ncbi:MAG: tetratricopeptide repeat protein [Stappiaceae bacterium]
MRNLVTKFFALFILMFPSNARATENTLSRLEEIHRIVLDPEEVFSASETLAELDELGAILSEEERESKAHGELAYLRGFIFSRTGEAEQSVLQTQEALRIDGINRFLTTRERSYALYNLAGQAEEIEEWTIAIEAFQQAIPLFDQDPDLDEGGKIGLRERLGFTLHEAGRYEKALDVNKEALERGIAFGGKDNAKLNNTLTNLAQNAYELGDLETARLYLDRRLSIALKNSDDDNVDDSLFQLGVLSFEQGQTQEARQFMEQRVSLAEKTGDDMLISDAKEDLRILLEKLSK